MFSSRFITIAGGDIASVKLATLLLFTFPGAPSIYYGDEIGLTGALPDHWARKSFPWDDQDRWDMDLLAFHKDIIALRQTHAALRTGEYHRLYADGHVYAFARVLDNETLIVAMNAGDTAETVDVPLGSLGHPAAVETVFATDDDVRAEVVNGTVKMTMPPRTGGAWGY